MRQPNDTMAAKYPGLFFSDYSLLWQQIKRIIGVHKHWLYVADEQSVTNVKEFFEVELVDNEGDVVSSGEFFLREQVVRAKPVMKALQAHISAIPAEMQADSVFFFEMTWAVRTPSGDIYLRELHEAFQELLVSYPVTIVCVYNESVLLDEQLLLGLFSHPEIYTHEGLKANPYYLPPRIIKKNQLKPRFNYWLSTIDTHQVVDEVQVAVETNDEKQAYPLERPFQTMTAQTNEGRWKIRCLGEVRIYRENGQLIDWNTKAGATRKLKTLFAFLLIRGEKGANTEELADLLWSEADSIEQSLNRLYHAIRFLRLVLNGHDDASKQSSFIVHQGSIYYLRLPYDSWIDLPMFQELCFKGNQHLKEGNLEQCKICYESAERLYTGDLFMDIPLKYVENNENDWCWSKRTWYREMYYKLLYSLAKIHRQMGNLSLAINYCDKALGENPNLEEAHKEKLLALAESKRFDALHRQYRIYTESLKKFNIGAPSEEIRQLYLNLSKKN